MMFDLPVTGTGWGGTQQEKMGASLLGSGMLFFDCSWGCKSEHCGTPSGVQHPSEQALQVPGCAVSLWMASPTPSKFRWHAPSPSKVLRHPAGYHTRSLTGLAPWWWSQSAREALLDVSLLAQNPTCNGRSCLPWSSACPWQAIPSYVVNHYLH